MRILEEYWGIDQFKFLREPIFVWQENQISSYISRWTTSAFDSFANLMCLTGFLASFKGQVHYRPDSFQTKFRFQGSRVRRYSSANFRHIPSVTEKFRQNVSRSGQTENFHQWNRPQEDLVTNHLGNSLRSPRRGYLCSSSWFWKESISPEFHRHFRDCHGSPSRFQNTNCL